MNLKYIPQVIGLLLSIFAIFWIVLYPTVEKGQFTTETEIASTLTTFVKVTYWNSNAVILSIFGFLICLVAELVSRIKPT